MSETKLPEIEIWERIEREDVRQNRDKIFLFGDNLVGRGFGGQAKEMRGEENAFGIPTKKAPDNNPNSFFSDKEFAENKRAIDEALAQIPPNKTIVIPKAGIGTGLARLSNYAPKTFAYLNEKFASLGFNNLTGEKIQRVEVFDKSVRLQKSGKNLSGQKRLLDLDNIRSPELASFSPTSEEVKALQEDRTQALADYAERLRTDYKENTKLLREGFKILSDSFDKGDQITITCSCRGGGEMCHADVVKMAIEKVSSFQKQKESQEIEKTFKNESSEKAKLNNKINELKLRTQRAVNEILAVSESDKLLEQINKAEGRNRSEQASFLGQGSQFVRDVYERGGTLSEGVLIIPQEKLAVSPQLRITTLEYAAQKITRITVDETRAKEIAPLIVEYADKISGLSADAETRLKVFSWIYDSLEGKSEFLEVEKTEHFSEKERFENTLEKIRTLADDLHSLEPVEKLEFVPLSGIERTDDSALDHRDENRILEEIYEDAIVREPFDDRFHQQSDENQSHDTDAGEKTLIETFERIDLSENAVPRFPSDFTETEINRLLTKTLPEIDRRLESGEPVKEILKPFNELVWQSKRDAVLNRLEKIYQKQKTGEIEKKLSNKNLSPLEQKNLENEKQIWKNARLTPTQENLRDILLNGQEKPSSKNEQMKTVSALAGKEENLSESLRSQIEKIDIFRQNVIELKSPGEFARAEKEAVSTFFRKLNLETASVQTKLGEIQSKENKISTDELKKELKTVQKQKPIFAFKLENSPEIVTGIPSKDLIEERNFIASYINYQLKQPETRLRHENDRYRRYAGQLESAATRDDLIKAASEIRAENASIGFRWKTLEKSERENIIRPLTVKEMQFLFTETSPKHYTSEMTAIRLSYAHSEASRRQMTESLLRGEIVPSPEARKLIEGLESRLQRRELKDATKATKHFFESIKLPNEKLKFKNEFDHASLYKQLPPQEKDFIYERAVHQKENLEYRLAFRQQFEKNRQTVENSSLQTLKTSKAEKSFLNLSRFYQARILGEKTNSSALATKELSRRDFTAVAILLNNETPEKIESIGRELRKNPENRKIGEILETFSKAEITKTDDKTIIQINLPENSELKSETYEELLDKIYPENTKESDKYKLSNFETKEIEHARVSGQTEAINFMQEEIKGNSSDLNISEIDQNHSDTIYAQFEEIKRLQDAARAARRENAGMIGRYSHRVAAKIHVKSLSVPPAKDQKSLVSAAFGIQKANISSSKANSQFFETVQKEITVSDFFKFTENQEKTNEFALSIKQKFTEISQKENVLEQSRGSEIRADKSNLEKPASLRLYETEINRAEKELYEEKASENKRSGENLSDKENLDRESIFTEAEKEEIKQTAAEIAKERLEPKELTAADNKFTPEARSQAFAVYKQLEKAHNLYISGADKSKIYESFSKLDLEAAGLNSIRQNYHRSETLAGLRENLKTDIADLLKPDAEINRKDFIARTSEILSRNLEKAGLDFAIGEKAKAGVLSKEIFQNLGDKRNFKLSDFNYDKSSNEHKSGVVNGDSLSSVKLGKVKDSPVFTR